MPEQKNIVPKSTNIENIKLEELVDLNKIKINKELPVQDKILNYVEQIKNPYLFKIDDVIVKVNFKDNGPAFQEKFTNYLKNCSKI